MRINVKKAHKIILKTLKAYQIKPEIRKIYIALLKDELKLYHKNKSQNKGAIIKSLSSLESKLEKVQDLYINGDLEKEDYTSMKKRYTENISELKAKIASFEDEDIDKRASKMEWGFGFAENLLYYYNKSNTDGKRLIIGSVFPENLTFENNKARTTKESDFFALMCYTNQQLIKIKKPNKNDLSGFVPRAGVEPAHPYGH